MVRPDLKEVEAALKWNDGSGRFNMAPSIAASILAAECLALQESLNEVSKMGELASTAAFRWEKAFQAETLARSRDIVVRDETIKLLEAELDRIRQT